MRIIYKLFLKYFCNHPFEKVEWDSVYYYGGIKFHSGEGICTKCNKRVKRIKRS